MTLLKLKYENYGNDKEQRDPKQIATRLCLSDISRYFMVLIYEK